MISKRDENVCSVFLVNYQCICKTSELILRKSNQEEGKYIFTFMFLETYFCSVSHLSFFSLPRVRVVGEFKKKNTLKPHPTHGFIASAIASKCVGLCVVCRHDKAVPEGCGLG